MANYTKQAERSRAAPGHPPTFGDELRAGCGWFWFICPGCHRRTPRALAPFAIRYGMDVPIVDVAKFAVCQGCRHRGALLQRPAVMGAGADMSREPFPVELATRGLENWIPRVTRTRCPAPSRWRKAVQPPTWAQ